MSRPLTLAIVLATLACAGAAEPADLAGFWRRGQVRELLLSWLPSDPAALRAYADAGVNCVLGGSVTDAHAHGLRIRSWFTMDYMDSRHTPEAEVRAMSAVNEEGGFPRPNDPLFPEIAQYGWTACVNNPLWIEHGRKVFEDMARAGYDGCHIDYADHYESCFCTHCEAKWLAWAAAHGLPGVALKAVAHGREQRGQMLLTEFRMRSVMEYLAGLRRAARAIRPGFGTDGTWHQDAGSAYQWAYGEHFDLMCIEGTTAGPFPPESTQVPWLKLAHALAAQPDRQPPAMSVTYHLLPDEHGQQHHGRMAPDRLGVALGEIVGQGGVSWLGLGGPNTGSLIREHLERVKACYAVARELQPALVDSREAAEVGLLFSPRSYLLSSRARTQLYTFAQALMRGHVAFRVLSDVGLRAGDLADLSGVVALSGEALSDAACTALDAWVSGGGRLLVVGAQTATVGEDWNPRAARPAFAVPADGVKRVGQGECRYLLDAVLADKQYGASQQVPLDQTQPVKLAVEGWSKAESVSGASDPDYSLYVDLLHQDGTPLWGQVAVFDTGTHGWQHRRAIITSDKPFKSANVHLLFRTHRGAAWFRDVRFGVWDEARQAIVTNLLGNRYSLPGGQVQAAAGSGPKDGTWFPYGEGYELENMLEQGWWVKASAAQGLVCGPMHEPDPAVAQVLALVQPLRSPQPVVEVGGAGADRVYAELVRSGEQAALLLTNYAAEVHPQASEAEQQQTDHSLPATGLTIRLRVPGVRLDAGSARALFPEARPEVACRAEGDGVVLTVDRLAQFGAVTFRAAER